MANVTIYSKRLGESPSGTGNGTKVTIFDVKNVKDTQSVLGEALHLTKTPVNYSSGDQTYLFDFLKRKKSITITGHLTGNSTDTAAIVERNLDKIVNSGGDLFLTLHGIKFRGNATKYNVTETPTDRIIAETSNAESAGADVVIEVNRTDGFAVGDKISVVGVIYSSSSDTITEYCEMTTISAISSGVSITATLANSYDSGAEVSKLKEEDAEFDVILQFMLGENKLG